ncbi:MAG: FlgD immunoglobulin-like domain containing protein, partial [bacterium]
AVAQFTDDFSSPTLDPAWTVVQTWPGGSPRAHGITDPGNRFSLTANPGHLRYLLDRMTHYDGYLNGYQRAIRFYSCCDHDAGLELLRTFSGENWLFETKVSYFMPFANGRFFNVRVYFGDGGVGTIYVAFERLRDGPWPQGTPETVPVRIRMSKKLVPPLPNGGQPVSNIEFVQVSPNPAGDTYSFRLERSGSILTAMWSYDGVTWNTAFTRDMGAELDGLTQLVAVAGMSWFVPAGSFADYDYISVTPTVIPVELDIKPRSCPNPLNTKSQGTLPVAILGTVELDVNNIDVSTVKLEGISPLRSDIEDVAAPVTNREDVCDCSTENPDLTLDLTLKFDRQEILEALRDKGEPLNDGDQVILTLTGKLIAGTPIEGRDCIIVKSKGKGKNGSNLSKVAATTLPESFFLEQNHPNPFNPETEIRFQLPEASHVVVRIFNTIGQEIRSLANARYEAGYHSLHWDGKDNSGQPVSSGVYFYQLRAGDFSRIRKMSLVR